MSYGLVRHNRRKVARANIGSQRSFAIYVDVQRSHSGVNMNSGGYCAEACVGKNPKWGKTVRGKQGVRKGMRCTFSGGTTPTKAAKKAVSALARKLM